MRALSKSEIVSIIQEGKRLSEQEGTAILDEFEKNQPHLYQAIFGPLSDGIAEYSLLSPLGQEKYHCHLNYRYVACWFCAKDEIQIEVYYTLNGFNMSF